VDSEPSIHRPASHLDEAIPRCGDDLVDEGPLEADVMRVVRAARLACRFGSGRESSDTPLLFDRALLLDVSRQEWPTRRRRSDRHPCRTLTGTDIQRTERDG
jgi:hypothetical protein